MPESVSTCSAYKMLTCIYLCRTLLFFAPYADFSDKNQINEILEKVRNKGFNEDSDDGYVISYRFHEKEIIENNTIGEYPLNNILTKLPDLIDSLYNKSDKVLNGTI